MKIEEISQKIHNGGVYTDYTGEVKEVLKGNFSAQRTSVCQPGGRSGDLISQAGPHPPILVGDEWIFALSLTDFGWYTVVGIKQGAFLIHDGIAEREYSGYNFIKAPPEQIIKGKGVEKLVEKELVRRLKFPHDSLPEQEKAISPPTMPEKAANKPGPIQLTPLPAKTAVEESEPSEPKEPSPSSIPELLSTQANPIWWIAAIGVLLSLLWVKTRRR
ncbi:MAG: hypothetical protein HQL31_06930 [Planctomycetes bacterium]|nr:hypothetical protein [Planctomycetota bacterium]